LIFGGSASLKYENMKYCHNPNNKTKQLGWRGIIIGKKPTPHHHTTTTTM
jgi:hypothetical protein